MRVYEENLSDVSKYISTHRDISIGSKKREFELLIEKIRQFTPVTAETRMLEIGIGTGWFPILCEMNGLRCEGLEISPQLVEYARGYAAECGVSPELSVGNVEQTDLGSEAYDVIVASSVFEHVEDWKAGLARVYRALKPGGVLYFVSTNRFALRSGEYNYPFYGWLPDRWRYALRIKRQGPDIMKLGIDFNQFTFARLRSFFRSLGFSEIADYLEFTDPERLVTPGRKKAMMMRAARRYGVIRGLALLFSPVTYFICRK